MKKISGGCRWKIMCSFWFLFVALATVERRLVLAVTIHQSATPSNSMDGDNGPVVAAINSGKSRGFFVGDFCDDGDQCNSGLPHTVCNAMTNRCECDPSYPIKLESGVCVPPKKLGEQCLYDQSCHYYDRNSVCSPDPNGEAKSDSSERGGGGGSSSSSVTDDGAVSECRCRHQFHPSITLESISRTSICIPEPHGPWLKSDVPTVIGLGVGMSLFMGLTCLVLKLFSRARFARDPARGYGNAHLAPPMTTVGSHSTNHHSSHHDGKHSHRGSYHRQASITDTEGSHTVDVGHQQQRRTNSISNGSHSRPHGSFHGRRQSSGYSDRGSMPRASQQRRGSAAVGADTSLEQLHQHPLQP